MTTAQRILDIARAELGTVEARDGANKYGRWYGMDRVAWCMQYVTWVFDQAGARHLIHPKTAYTPTAAQWHKDRGRFDRNPRVGSLVFYNWPDSVNRIQHVGIVEAIEHGSILALEGNTSTANQSDGGQVMRRRRACNSSIVGYGHPIFAAAPAAAPPAPPTPRIREDDVMYIRCQPPGKPVMTALLSGPMLVGLGTPGEIKSADDQIGRGAPCQWVELHTWMDLDRRSQAICANPRAVVAVNPTVPGPPA